MSNSNIEKELEKIKEIRMRLSFLISNYKEKEITIEELYSASSLLKEELKKINEIENEKNLFDFLLK